jgi:hypothetical protein
VIEWTRALEGLSVLGRNEKLLPLFDGIADMAGFIADSTRS